MLMSTNIKYWKIFTIIWEKLNVRATEIIKLIAYSNQAFLGYEFN